MAFETGEAGRRDNTHSTYAAKFRKALCFLRDEQVDRDSKEGASITASPKEPGAGTYLCLSSPTQRAGLMSGDKALTSN